MILGAGVFLFGGLTKLGLDLTNQKTRAQSQSRRAVTPLVIEGMQMPPEDGWTYHPPHRR